MTRLTTLAAALLAAISLSGCSTVPQSSSASPVLDRILESGTLRVGMSGSQPPFNVRSKSGDIIGMEADLANALASSIGVKAVLVELPFADLLDAIGDGRVDMVMSSLSMTPERNTRVAFAGPYFISGKAILTSSAGLARADDASELNKAGLGLAALAGSTSAKFVNEMVPNARLIPIRNYDEGIELVKDGRAHAMVADFPICLLSVLRNPDLATLVSPFTFEPLGAALPANDPLLVNLVQNYMTMLEGTGLMNSLRAKWLEDSAWLRELP